MIKKRFTILLLILLAELSWGATGSIEGTITDSTTGEPLMGANVFLEGTSIGAATNIDGQFLISAIPVGSYSLKISYLGYETQEMEINLKANENLELKIKLAAVSVSTTEVVVTAQASGQNSAINQQLSSNNIANIVSSARIQSLPDANAAESIGRLPGISLVRSGGQATKVVIRGLQPQYNTITINGVPIPSNDAGSISTGGDYSKPSLDPGGRGVDLSMISSNSLEGISVYKTVTPDMDAAVLGGTVNFGLREAKGTPSGLPSVSLLAQGAYNDLASTYDDYKFVAGAEQRFFDGRLGAFVQGIAQKQNLISNQLGGSYYQPNKDDKPDSVVLGRLNLIFSPTDQRRYDGILTLDYKLPHGKINLLNLISHGSTTNKSHSQTYNLRTYGNGADNVIQFGTLLSSNKQNVVTNILEYEQALSLFNVDLKLSNAYSDNRTPNGWNLIFQQNSAGTIAIPNYQNPIQIAKTAQDMINLDNMLWAGNSIWSSFNKQNDVQGSVELEKNFNFSNEISVTLKGGGQYRYTTRYYNFDNGFGSLYTGAAAGFRYNLVQSLPWLTQPPYNLDPTGRQYFPISGFYNQNMDFGKFLKGDYEMFSAVNEDVIDKIMNQIKILGAATTQPQTVPSYVPDRYSSIANDYTGNEFRSAEYLMGTFNIGPQITIISGVRYQGLKTSYTAAHFIGNADATNPYPSELIHSMVTEDEYHGYWLPSASVKYDMFQWLSFRGSYTTTLAYPDFHTIIPRLDVASNSGHWVAWNNYALKPAQSHNYDFQVAVYNNEVGLFAVSPFLKRIDNLIFKDSTFIVDPSKYPGIPGNTRTFSLDTYINNPNRIDVWGIETEWQTHFWYLPDPFSGLVLNVNYTHIFSEAKYPYTVTRLSPVYPFLPVHIDTTYTDRLIQQPNDIVNLSLGYDYKQFSILASMIYQAQVYYDTDFYNSRRSDKSKYLRWDISVKQGLPWYNLEIYFDINNLNSEADIYLVRGSGFPNSESHYGLTADLGIRWKLE